MCAQSEITYVVYTATANPVTIFFKSKCIRNSFVLGLLRSIDIDQYTSRIIELYKETYTATAAQATMGCRYEANSRGEV